MALPASWNTFVELIILANCAKFAQNSWQLQRNLNEIILGNYTLYNCRIVTTQKRFETNCLCVSHWKYLTGKNWDTFVPICIETAMCNNLIAIAKVNLMKIKKDSLPPEMISRTPWIVKGNKSLNLVWFKWGSQWWGILKHFPQRRCILISHWSREK